MRGGRQWWHKRVSGADAVLAEMVYRLSVWYSKTVRNAMPLGFRRCCGWEMLEAVVELSLPRGDSQ